MATRPQKPLEKEFHYYLENRDKLIKEHGSRYIVIKADRVMGAYETQDEALEETLKDHELGTFLMRRADSPITPMIFHRVAIDGAGRSPSQATDA